MTDKKPSITVIVAVYNMEKYLNKCLDSILSQTLKNIEVLCINDGSTDDSLSILKSYANRYKRIRLLTQDNHGFAKTRNRGIDSASGEYLVFMDPDDWYPEKDILKSLYVAAVNNNALVCGGCFSEFNERTQSFKNVYGGILKDYMFDTEGFVEYKDYQFDYGPHRFIYKSDFLRENDLYFPNRARFQDTTFLIKTLELAKKFYAIPKIVYCYRLGHQETVWNEKKGTDLVYGVIENLEFAKEHQYAKLYYLTAHRLFVDFYSRVLPCCTEDNDAIRKAIESIKQNFDWTLIKRYKEYDKFYDTIKNAFYNAENGLVVSLNTQENISNKQTEHKEKIKIIRKDGSYYYVDSVPGLTLTYVGKNTTVEIKEPIPRFNKSRLELGENAIVRIGSSSYRVLDMVVMMSAKNSTLIIGDNFSCNGGVFAICDESNLSIVIGNNCMFSTRLRLRTSDGHAIIDRKSKEVINKGASINIGDGVWLGSGCSILKGVNIPNGCVVGANAVVTNKIYEANSVLAGNPAKTIKNDITWTRKNTEMYLNEFRNFEYNEEMEKSYEGPLVSIVVPIYNVENYLRECMESLVNQSLKNIEIILVNDGSTDGSEKIIEEYREKDERIKVVSHANHGYGYSMNAGFDVATGKYIGIVEPDDYVDLRMFEKLFVAAERFNVDCVKSNFYNFDGDGENRKIELKELSKKYDFLYYTVITPRYEPRAFNFTKNNWTGIYKRDFITSCKIKHNETPGASYQDNGFWFQVFSRLNKMVFIKDAFYYYRQDNPNSSINSSEKAFIIFDEWDFIKRKCYFNITNFENVAKQYARNKYTSLYWHYNRIKDSFKPRFLVRFREYLDDIDKQGFLTTPLFSEYELNQIKAIRGNKSLTKNETEALIQDKKPSKKPEKKKKKSLKRAFKDFMKKMPGIKLAWKKYSDLRTKAEKNEREIDELRQIVLQQKEVIERLKNK